jgi:hypothetical protein
MSVFRMLWLLDAAFVLTCACDRRGVCLSVCRRYSKGFPGLRLAYRNKPSSKVCHADFDSPLA